MNMLVRIKDWLNEWFDQRIGKVVTKTLDAQWQKELEITALRHQLEMARSERDEQRRNAHEKSVVLAQYTSGNISGEVLLPLVLRRYPEAWFSILGRSLALANVDFFLRESMSKGGRGGGKIEAIKILRQMTGIGLRESKDAVEARMVWLQKEQEEGHARL